MAFWLVFYQFWFPLFFFKTCRCIMNIQTMFWRFRSLHSSHGKRLRIETQMQTATSSKQHFIPGMNYPNRHLIMICENKKDVCFWRHANSLLYRSDVNRVDGVFFLKLLNLEHLEQAKKKLKPRGHCWNSILLYNRWLEVLMKTGKVGGSHSSSHQE